MPLTVINTADNTLVHKNNYVAEDLNSPQLVEACREIELPFGNAHLAHWYFDGIRMAYSNWRYKNMQAIEWNSDLDVVTFYFNIKGRVTLESKEFEAPFTFSSGQYNLFYSGSFNGRFTNHELMQEVFILQFTKEVFARIVAETGKPLQAFAVKVKEGLPLLLANEHLYLDVAMHHAVRQIAQCRYEGAVKKLFLHSKCLELVAAVIDGLERSANKTVIICKSDYDRERILFARDYLVQHLDMPPSLSELARVAGINEYKLKHGFKELFNTTVFGYLAEERLELARHDILEGKKTATEIAFELGFASPQHFSKAYKNKFGVSPKRGK